MIDYIASLRIAAASCHFSRWAIYLMTLTIFASWSCSGKRHTEIAEEVRIGMHPLEQNALIYIADHERFFAKNGIHISIKSYDSGMAAIKAALNGAVDIAVTSEFPFVRTVLAKEDVCVIACDDKFENDYLLGLKDRGIEKVSDLKGKRIGVALGTIAEYYLDRFLVLNSIDIRDVKLVDLSPSNYMRAIAGHKIDAIISGQPYVYGIQRGVSGATVWKAQSGQATYGVLVCGRQWVVKHADTVKRLLKSLQDAEDFLISNPGRAKAIIKKRLGYDDAYVEQIWPRHTFSLSLDQDLVLEMTDESLWLINHRRSKGTTIPDFANYIYDEGLESIDPYAVNIIH